MNNSISSDNQISSEVLIYKSGWFSSLVVLLVSAGFLFMLSSFVWQQIPSSLWNFQLVAEFIGVLILLFFVYSNGRDLLVGLRRLELSGTTLTIVYPLQQSIHDLSELAELNLKQFVQSAKQGSFIMYRVTFTDPDLKRHYFALTGKKGAQIVLRLLPFAKQSNVDIQTINL